MLKRIIYLLGKDISKYVFIILLTIVAAVLETASLTLIFPFINMLINPNWLEGFDFLKKSGITSFEFQMVDSRLILLVLVISVFVIKNLYLFFMYKYQYRTIYRSQTKLSGRLFASYLSMPYHKHISSNSAILLRNLTTEITRFIDGVVLPAILVCTEMFVLVAYVIYLFVMQPVFTIGAFFLLGSFFYFITKAIKKKANYEGELFQKHNTQLIKIATESINGIKEVKVFNKKNFFSRKYDDNAKLFTEARRKYMLLAQAPRLIIETFGMIIIMLIAYNVGTRYSIEKALPLLGIFAFAAVRLLPSVSRINTYLSSISFCIPAVQVLSDDLKVLESIIVESDDMDGNNRFQSLEIKNITHWYEADKVILNDITLKFEANKSYAIIGESGSGKSTLLNILLGLIQPSHGNRLYNDVIVEWTKSLEKVVSFVPQTIGLLDDTLERNVAYGINDEDINVELLKSCIHKAQLDNVVESLPHGIKTIIGEKGAKLSGGQCQRIGIARALYCEPDILVMDEATSALDHKTEDDIIKAINKLKNEMTVVIVAHRLSSIKDCDEIYKIEKGRLIKQVNTK